MPSLIPVCPSPTHPHAHTTYVAERNSNPGKDREKERLAWMSVPLHGRVCVSVGTCVYICGVSRRERFPWVFGGTCRLGSGWKAAPGIRLCTYRLGVGERVGSGFLTQKPLPPLPPIPSLTYPPPARQVAIPPVSFFPGL